MASCSSNYDYYSVLGVTCHSSNQQIRSAYHKLAKKWHPDRWTRCPSVLAEANTKFQQIQQAYSVLSDERKRKLHDSGLYDVVYDDEDEEEEEEEEGFSGFMEELGSLMAEARREEKKSYSFEELQTMFVEMAKSFDFDFDSDFDSKHYNCEPMPNVNHHGSSWSNKRIRLDDTRLGFYAQRSCCN